MLLGGFYCDQKEGKRFRLTVYDALVLRVGEILQMGDQGHDYSISQRTETFF